MSDDEIQSVDETSASTSTETSNDAAQVEDDIQPEELEELADEIQPEDLEEPVDEIQPEKFEEWVVNIEDQLKSDPAESLQASTDNNSEQKPSIVSDILKPKLVHFETRNAGEFVTFMCDNCGLNLRSYLEDIDKNKDLVLSYYQTKEKYSSSQVYLFLKYLVFNSCILVFAILSFQNKWNTKIVDSTETKEKTTDPRDPRYSGVFDKLHQSIIEDPMVFKCEMLSMDCQIPWFVVEVLYTKHLDLRKLVIDTPIDKLALSCFEDLYPRVHKSKVQGATLPPGGFKHLLHMFHWTRSPEGKFMVETRSLQPIKMNRFYVPSATDLQVSATVFKKHVGDSVDMFYHDKRFSGVMELAPWHIFGNIEIYKALLVFESVYGELCGYPITAYVACMVQLLQTDDDVKILRANGIIPNTCGNRNNVLCCVKELKELLLDDVPMSDDLYNLSKKMTAHHERKSPRYYEEFKSRYFTSPWITISVVAGIIYFLINFIGTIFEINYYT